jgi:hypothetical protein
MRRSSGVRFCKQQGHVIPFSALEYTIAELSVADDAVVVKQANMPLLVGAQFNEFVRENYKGLLPAAKRSRPLAEVRREAALHALRGRLTLELLARGEARLGDPEVAAVTRKFARRTMFRSVAHLREIDTKAPIREVMADLVARTRADSTGVIA